MPSTMLRERHRSCRDLNVRPFEPENSGEWCSIDHFRLSGVNKQPKLVTLPALVTYVGWPIEEASADGDVAMEDADGAGGQGDRPLEVRSIEIQQRVRAVANDRQFLVGLAGAAPDAALEAFTFHCRITRLQQSLNDLIERGVQASDMYVNQQGLLAARHTQDDEDIIAQIHHPGFKPPSFQPVPWMTCEIPDPETQAITDSQRASLAGILAGTSHLGQSPVLLRKLREMLARDQPVLIGELKTVLLSHLGVAMSQFRLIVEGPNEHTPEQH